MARLLRDESLVSQWQNFFEEQYKSQIETIALEYPMKRSVFVDYWDIDKADPKLSDILTNQPYKAILNADLIVIGPGSLYTSLLPNLLVPDLAEAVRASRALKLFVCNVATERGETDDYSCGDHLRALEEHVGDNLFEIAIVNQRCEGTLPDRIRWVISEPDLDEDYPIYQADLIDVLHPWRHDSKKLAQVIMELYQERTGPLVE